MDPQAQNLGGAPHDTAALAESLRRVIGVFVRAIRGEAATPSSSQSETLALLADKGPMTIAALAHLRQVKHQSMRLVLAHLEQNDLVATDADAADRRSRPVAITDAGRKALFDDRSTRAKAIENRIREALTSEDRDILAAAVPILERLCYAPASGAGASRLS